MSTSISKITSVNDYLKKLDRACRWVNIKRGRALEYGRILNKFSQRDTLENTELMAYFESLDLVELYTLWYDYASRFPNLNEGIRKVFEKGRLLSDEERVGSSGHRSRNDSFSYQMAGRFLSSGISVLSVETYSRDNVDESADSDFSFSWKGSVTHVQCKRLRSNSQLEKRVGEAKDQVVDSRRFGLIAIDCSLLYRPPEMVYENKLPTQLKLACSNWLQNDIWNEVYPRVVENRLVLGMILYCRFPAMTLTQDPNGGFTNRRDCITSILCCAEHGNPHSETLMSEIDLRLRALSMGKPKPPLVA